MEMKKYSDEFLSESYYKINHDSGLTVYVMPKDNMKTCYAVFGTDYGSVDTRFAVKGEDFTDVPEGIAHFLEHKLFESDELNAFERYSKTGASANAYTSFDKTCYLFSCTANFEESLGILLDFVKHPYFTKENVEKEMGIIGQEIKMYSDSPERRATFNLLRALYHKNPVRTDIAGTVESIKEIDADLLYRCYNTFYNLRNMVLCVAGNVTPEQVQSVVDSKIEKEEPVRIIREEPREPWEIVTGYIEEDMNVGVKKFNIGFKEKLPENSLRYSIEISIALELICGRATDFFDELLAENLINLSFGTEYFKGRGFALNLFGGESENPKEVKRRILERIRFVKENGVDEKEFEAVRRKLYGAEVKCFNDADVLANGLMNMHFDNYGMFDMFDIYRNVKKEDIDRVIRDSFDESVCALSVIK